MCGRKLEGSESTAADYPDKKPIYIWFGGSVMDGKDRIEIPKEFGLSELDAGDFIVNSHSTRMLLENDLELLEYLRGLDTSLWYHGDEKLPPIITPPLHELSPRVTRRPSLVDGLKWDDAYQAVYDRFTHEIKEDGSLDLSKAGGLAIMEEVYGRKVSHDCSWRICYAPSGWAFDQIASPVMTMGIGMAHGLNRCSPEVARRYATMGGESDFFWYMGVINNNPNRYLSTHDREGLEVLKKVLDGCDRSRIRMVMIDVQTRMSDQDKAHYRQYIDYLVNEFFPKNPGSRFISSKVLTDLIVPEKGKTIEKEKLGEAAQYLVEHWDGRPPKYVELKGDYLSLADCFQALVGALASYKRNGVLPEEVKTTELYGPVCDIEEGSKHEGLEGSVNPSDLLSSAEKVNVEIIRYRSAELTVRPPNRVPHTVRIADGKELNAAEYLLLMAKEYLKILENGEPGDVDLEPADILSPAADILDEVFSPEHPYPLWYSKLQMWTLKPIRWKSEMRE